MTTIQDEQILFENSILFNIDLLNKNKCIKILRKKFYKSLLTNDFVFKLKKFKKLFMKLNTMINNFKLPNLKYNFSNIIFFANNNNIIYFTTTFKNNSSPYSTNNTSLYAISNMLERILNNTLLLLSIPFLTFIKNVNTGNDLNWQSHMFNDQKIRLIKSGSISGIIEEENQEQVQFKLYNVNEPTPDAYIDCYCNEYTGFRLTVAVSCYIIFTKIPKNTIFGICSAGIGGSRNGSFGGGGAGCFYKDNLPYYTFIPGIKYYYYVFNNSTQFNFSIMSGNTEVPISNICVICENGGDGGDGETNFIGRGGNSNITTYTKNVSSVFTTNTDGGFFGGDGAISYNFSGQNALSENNTVIGSIPCVPGITTLGGGGGTTNSATEFLYATSGNGYGGESYTSKSIIPTNWPVDSDITSYGGGAGTTYNTDTGSPNISDNGSPAVIFVWWKYT